MGRGKIQYRSTRLNATSDQGKLSSSPALPGTLVGSDRKLVGISHQRNSQQKWLLGKLLEPTIVRKLRIPESGFCETFGIFVDKRHYAKFLRESPQLAERGGLLQQVDEMRPDPPFREKAQSFTRVRALSDSKDLNFQDCPRYSRECWHTATINFPAFDQ
jgi:hypothetical protein